MGSSGLFVFGAAAGFMAGIAVAFAVAHLWNSQQRTWAVGAATLVALLSFAAYYQLGTPVSASATPAVDSTAHAANGAAAPGSLEDAIQKLAAKLGSGAGTDAEWELLAQSYEFLGDASGAELARQHQLKPGAATQVSAAGEDPSALLRSNEQLAAAQPRNAGAWRAIAQLQRSARRFAEARQAYEKVIELDAMDADTWADYADVCATTGSLSDATVGRAIEAALKLDSGHPQALWLKASVAHAEHRYAEAVTLWQRLRSVLPEGSSDLAVIDANIAEDMRLSGKPVSTPVAAQAAARIQGTVQVDASVKARAQPGMTLFIYAKATDSPAPVAAYRTTIGAWPMSFVLDDSHAMMPARKLSMYPEVRLEARLSRTGQAMASSGDLQARAVTVSTRGGAQVTLTISEVVP